MTQPSQAAAAGEPNKHETAEAGIAKYSYSPDLPGAEYNQGAKRLIKLARTDRVAVVVQVLKEGGENNLHYHANTDLLYMPLKGRVRFYGVDDVLYGEFGPQEGLVLPADSRYWFESCGTEPLELFQVVFRTGSPESSRRINVTEAKPWMAGDPELLHTSEE